MIVVVMEIALDLLYPYVLSISLRSINSIITNYDLWVYEQIHTHKLRCFDVYNHRVEYILETSQYIVLI